MSILPTNPNLSMPNHCTRTLTASGEFKRWAYPWRNNKITDINMLSEIIFENVTLNLVELDIYSVYPAAALPASYGSIGASTIYDLCAVEVKSALDP